MSQAEVIPAVYSVSAAARLLALSPQTVLRRLHDGTLPAVRIGRRFKVHRERLNRLINGEMSIRAAPITADRGTDSATSPVA